MQSWSKDVRRSTSRLQSSRAAPVHAVQFARHPQERAALVLRTCSTSTEEIAAFLSTTEGAVKANSIAPGEASDATRSLGSPNRLASERLVDRFVAALNHELEQITALLLDP